MDDDDPVAQLVLAAADLVIRAGGSQFEIAWDCPHDIDDRDHSCDQTTWTCSAHYKGYRIFTRPYSNPGLAAAELATKILEGAVCRCGQTVALPDKKGGGCRWVLAGSRWEPGCDEPSIDMAARGVERGDLVGMNRAARRARRRRRKRP